MLTPVAKRILIQPVQREPEKILIANQKPTRFTVISIGNEVTQVKPGNIIYLEKHYGVEIEHENVKYFVIDEGSILAKID